MPPRQRKSTGRVKTLGVLHRPLTRASAKAQELVVDDTGSIRPGKYRFSRPSRTKKSTLVREDTAVKGRQGARRPTVESEPPKPAIVSSKAKKPRKPGNRSKEAKPSDKDNSVSVWLTNLDTPPPPPSSSPSPPSRHRNAQDVQEITSLDLCTQGSSARWEVESMDTSNTTTGITSQNPTTTRTIKAKKAKTSYKELLEFRGITDRPSQDRQIKGLRLDQVSVDAIKPLGLERIDDLISMLQGYVEKFRTSVRSGTLEDRFEIYEALKDDLENWRPIAGAHRRFSSVSLQNFNYDREHSRNSSEADFQRTVMISIIDRYDFKNMFTFSCEERWTLEDDYLLPTLGSPNKIQQPKPDLAISFQRDAFTGPELVAYPINLSRCLHPGANGEERWFPFLFLEAKKSDDGIRKSAQQRNLHNASQALFNIYQWMRGHDDSQKSFFENVRVFTIALNTEDIRLRIHRAEKGQGGRLVFNFSEVVSFKDYNQTIANHLVKSVLLDYAKPHLYPALKKAFTEVVTKEMVTTPPENESRLIRIQAPISSSLTKKETNALDPQR